MPLVVLEDVHWADQASLDVLRVLGRRIDSTGAFVLATYRDDEVTGDHPLRVVLGELASTPGVVRLGVPRLCLDAVRELAEPTGADAEAIHGLTEGMPSTSPRCWRRAVASCPRRCGTRCSRASRSCSSRRGGCSRPSRSCRSGPSSGCSNGRRPRPCHRRRPRHPPRQSHPTTRFVTGSSSNGPASVPNRSDPKSGVIAKRASNPRPEPSRCVACRRVVVRRCCCC